MSDSPYIQEVTAENFEQVVIHGSMERPVLVDFWASWCQPCQMLMPVLAKLAEEYQGRFILAKVNTEEQQAVAAQFGIRSIPDVRLFHGGREVDGFTGALPESAIREFLDKHIPRESDSTVEQAMQALAAGDTASAITALEAAAAADPDNPRIPVALAQTHMTAGDWEAAKAALDRLPASEQDQPEVTRLLGQLHFASEAPPVQDLPELETRLAADENDSEARYRLAMGLVLQQRFEQAIEHLLTLMRKDRQYGDDAARKALLRLFDMLGDDPLAQDGRRRLFNLMH
ncbi:thioredoxin [endosymbiont of unidentified scaly snail isolate Monju]|uniref:thioredoxin n=1 Tax=endosymbiont of unidentified scaly snail isolate Monju TaxID=1248727 RepID=UPI0003892D91|nr:thioredoxin [endosymbiont of unidentified scaly snail isolate Monju]BAN69402.1 thioredoxin [endosymbiont of unidentified scaly snail isolate Monju]